VGQPQVELANLAVGAGELVEHLVESLREPSDLIGGADDHAAVEIAALDVAHGREQSFEAA
jgi:hypothetical protein